MSFEGQELRTGFYNKERSKTANAYSRKQESSEGEGNRGRGGEEELEGRTCGGPVWVLVGSHSFHHKCSNHCVLWKGKHQPLQYLQRPRGEQKADFNKEHLRS